MPDLDLSPMERNCSESEAAGCPAVTISTKSLRALLAIARERESKPSVSRMREALTALQGIHGTYDMGVVEAAAILERWLREKLEAGGG